MAKKKKSSENKYENWFDKHYPERKTIKGILVTVNSYTCTGVNVLRPNTLTLVNRDNTPLEGHVAEGEIILPDGYDKSAKRFILNKKAYLTAKEKVTIIDNVTSHEVRVCKIVNLDSFGTIVQRPRKRRKKI